MSPAPDAAAIVEIPGPWQHRYIAANGARFHVVDTDPLARELTVVLLHGFPQFWWAWRAQLSALQAAGYRAVAIDLRGYGGSDKPPRGYDTFTQAADVDGVIRSLGIQDAVLVGHSWGGWIAWAMPNLHPRTIRGLVAVGTAHPAETLRGLLPPTKARRIARLASFQLPFAPERRLIGGSVVTDVLRTGSATSGWPDDTSLARYRDAMRIPSVAHCSLEYYRWAFRSRFRQDGRNIAAALRPAVTVPVLQLHGSSDPQVPPKQARRSARHVDAGYSWRPIEGGHFLAEESPEAFNQALLEWLSSLR